MIRRIDIKGDWKAVESPDGEYVRVDDLIKMFQNLQVDFDGQGETHTAVAFQILVRKLQG